MTVPCNRKKHHAVTGAADFLRMKWLRFLQNKRGMADALRSFIPDVAMTAGLKVGAIRGRRVRGAIPTDAERACHYAQAHAPGTPLHNGVARRVLGLLKKTVAVLEELAQGGSQILCAEAMKRACDMSTVCVATANEGGTSPYKEWHETPSTLGEAQSFGTVGYLSTET